MRGRLGARNRLVCGWVVFLLALSVPAGATAKGAPRRKPKPVVVHLAFRRAGHAAVLVSNQRYAFAAPAEPAAPGRLFDDLRHKQASVAQDGCPVAGSQIFGDTLAFFCVRSDPRLYSIASGTSLTVPLSAGVANPCAPVLMCGPPQSLVNAGTNWLEFMEAACPQGEHCSYYNLFQNVATGAVEQDPAVPGGNEIGDLDAPQLAQPVCAPLTVPEGFNIYPPPGPGELRFDGSFALATSPGPGGGFQTYLERCRTDLHQLIESGEPGYSPGPFAASRHAIVWEQTTRNLEIEFLPSRERFRVAVPRGSDPEMAALALTDERLYAIDQSGTLWIAPVPAKPPPWRPASGR